MCVHVYIFPGPSRQTTVHLIIWRFLICKSTYLQKFICNPQINVCSAFMVICRHIQSNKKLEQPFMHVPSWNWTRWCSPSCFSFHAKMTRGGRREAASLCRARSSGWDQLDGLWIQALALASDAASWELHNISETHCLFCKIRKLENNKMNCF